MKCLVFAAVLAILVAPAAAVAKDAGPASSPATMKVEPKKAEPKKEAPASSPAKAEPKIEGKVEPKKDEVKLTPPADDFDLWGALKGIYTDFKAGKVWDGISLLLMVLTFVFFKVKEGLPVKYAVWIAAGLGVATNIVSAIVGGVGWGPALTAGLFQGAAAAGFWTMIGKHVFRSKDEKAKRVAAREMAENGQKASGEVETKPIEVETKPDKPEDDTE